MKKLAGLVLAGIMTISSAAICMADEIKTMTVDEAVEYALNNSLEIIKCNANITSAKYQKFQSKNTEEAVRRADTVTNDTFLVASGYAKKAANVQYDISLKNKEEKEKDVIVQVKKDFYTCINSQKSVELAEQNLQNAIEKLNSAKTNLDNGAISPLDYKNFELLKMTAENSLNSAKRDLEINLLTFKNTLNYPANKNITPTGSLEDSNKELPDAEEAIKLSRETNKYYIISQSFELAKERWSLMDRHYTSSSNTFRIEEATYKIAEADYKNNVNTLDMSIRTLYNSLLTLSEAIECSEFNLEISKTNTDAIYLKYEMGAVSANDYRESQQKYFDAQNQLQTLKLNYLTAELSYENIINK